MRPRSDLVVLLGAGASVPGMLSTAAVTAKLRSWPAYREPDPAPPDPLGALLPFLGQPDPRRPLFDALHAVIAGGVRDPAFLNFEHLVHAAEVLASLLPLPPSPATADAYRFLPAPLLDVNALSAAWNIPGPAYWTAAGHATYEILDWFDTTCSTVSVSSHPQAVGLRTLAERNRLRIFSLNYDDIPLAAGLNYYTGFAPDGAFSPRYPWPTRGHTLCQLHGSVRFGLDGFEVKEFPTRADAKAARKGRRSGAIFHDGHHAGGGAPMITGLRKADKTLARPFGTYMHVFREELLRSNRWLIVGYSFGDLHVNAALEQARANWRKRGLPVKTVIIDFYQPIVDSHGEAVLDAGYGSDGGEKLSRLCNDVFGDDLNTFWKKATLPRLDPSLFTQISDDLAIDLTGTAKALSGGLGRIESFLRQPLLSRLRFASGAALGRLSDLMKP